MLSRVAGRVTLFLSPLIAANSNSVHTSSTSSRHSITLYHFHISQQFSRTHHIYHNGQGRWFRTWYASFLAFGAIEDTRMMMGAQRAASWRWTLSDVTRVTRVTSTRMSTSCLVALTLRRPSLEAHPSRNTTDISSQVTSRRAPTSSRPAAHSATP